MTRSPGADWERWYRALKAADPDAYSKAIRYTESVAVNYSLPMNAAAEMERSHVMLACELLGVQP